nr:MAG TPA: hypothetical protein [Caudoviricetes sp.]
MIYTMTPVLGTMGIYTASASVKLSYIIGIGSL